MAYLALDHCTAHRFDTPRPQGLTLTATCLDGRSVTMPWHTTLHYDPERSMNAGHPVYQTSDTSPSHGSFLDANPDRLPWAVVEFRDKLKLAYSAEVPGWLKEGATLVGWYPTAEQARRANLRKPVSD